MLKSVDNYQVEILLTLAIVTGGYALAHRLHISGPIAIVVAGLLIGNHGRMFAMSETTNKNLDTFWELTDEILNAVLFLLIGLEILILDFSMDYSLMMATAVPIVLFARFVSVGIPVYLFRWFREFSPDWRYLYRKAKSAASFSLPLTSSLSSPSQSKA
jgi:CPA1 family monovalent cation:H+ antiporter